jgi:hypothetical protein
MNEHGRKCLRVIDYFCGFKVLCQNFEIFKPRWADDSGHAVCDVIRRVSPNIEIIGSNPDRSTKVCLLSSVLCCSVRRDLAARLPLTTLSLLSRHPYKSLKQYVKSWQLCSRLTPLRDVGLKVSYTKNQLPETRFLKVLLILLYLSEFWTQVIHSVSHWSVKYWSNSLE